MAAIITELFGSFPGHHRTASSLSSAAAAVPIADGVDPFSALTDDLLGEVVARLPGRDAARTAALAKRWRKVWRSTPLVLRDDDLLPASAGDSARAAASATTGRILAYHPGPFRMVHLPCSKFASRERELAEWTRLLVDKHVEDLVFYDDTSPVSVTGMRLPADILRCTSLKRLFLGTWMFPDIAGAQRDPKVFPRLKELGMCSTNTSDHDLDYMLACSPELETLALILTMWPEGFCLRSQSLQCMLLLSSSAKELAVLDAPRLQRLIMHQAAKKFVSDDKLLLIVKIDHAPELRVLGCLEPAGHQLQIGSVIINAETMASPSSILPSVQILALKVNFSEVKEANMMSSFLRCFPNVETLYIESTLAGKPEATGWHHAEFWLEVYPIECLKSRIKKIVIRKFRGNQSEFEFLKFIAMRAEKMQVLLLELTEAKFSSTEEVNEINCQVGALTAILVAEKCRVLLQGPKVGNHWSFSKLSDLSVQDPFSV